MKGVQPARARAEGQADAHRGGLRKAERHHEGNRGNLERDGMRGQCRCAEQAHQQYGGVEDKHLEGEGHADGKTEPP